MRYATQGCPLQRLKCLAGPVGPEVVHVPMPDLFPEAFNDFLNHHLATPDAGIMVVD
jgi:hypothetical protein